MSYAPDYTPGTSFADDETNNVAGRSLVKTDSLDAELADISASINALNDNQKAFQRDDGKLADSLVEPYALAEQTRALIAVAGCNPRGTWAPDTDYNYKDVIQRSNIAQICLQSHNSGSTFTQSFWLPISGDGTSAANAAAAAASASAAATSQTAAAASATAAAGSATSASTSATNAATSATNASNSASSASTSAANAANSATESAVSAASAAASAASINAPVNATNDSTFSSASSTDSATPEWVIGFTRSNNNRLLGTLTTTSGTVQTLSSLDLSGYKFVKLVFDNVANSAGDAFNINGPVGFVPATGSAGRSIWGILDIDLFTGVFTANVNTGSSTTGIVSGQLSSVQPAGKCSVTNASTSINISCNSGNFTSGSIRIYGVL